MSFFLLIVQSILLLKIAEGAQKCYFGDFVDGKVKECKESSWKCATLTCPGTIFRGCLSPNGVCDDLINLFTSCKESSPQCFLCEGDLCNDNSTDTSNKKFEATSVLSGDNNTNITEESSTAFIAKDVPIESSTNITATNSSSPIESSPIESITNQNATAEMLKSNAGNNTVNGSSKNSNSQYYIQSFLIALFFVVATII
uniref:Uncharacterized protein n=1 Tax=Meloidogyne floridensis TaxID=298350 RepID=A0A915NZQ1_9BILA